LSGQTSLAEITVNGINNYVAYTKIPATEYTLITIVPTSELSDAIENSRKTIDAQFSLTIRYGAIILGILLLVAVLASLGVGNIIAAPVRSLTQAAEQLAAGNLDMVVSGETDDEIGRLANAFNNMTLQIKDLLSGMEVRIAERSAELSALSTKNERRAAQFQAIAKVVEAISTTRNLDELLPSITHVISEQFGFYHAGIFLLSENEEYAILSAANSPGGQRMLERGHKLKVGVVGIVGSVAATKRPLIALDTGNNPTYFNNPDLPETRSEMALPLLTSTNIIGVLDVQSTESNAFGLEDVEVLSTLASQVSVAIINARLYDQTENTIREAETLSRETIRQGWKRYTKSQKVFGIRRYGSKATILHDADRSQDPNLDAVRLGVPVKLNSNSLEDSELIVPVKLRGEVIGSLRLKASGDRRWTDDDAEVAAAIVERAAITLENARLLFESQKRADKERVITEITSRIGSFISRENILQSTATEIGRILPGAEVIVQLQQSENDKGPAQE
jgi:GAF domain-containing protein/HAMP domain-containing protein